MYIIFRGEGVKEERGGVVCPKVITQVNVQVTHVCTCVIILLSF